MDWGTRLFWGFMAWVAINLAWLRFLEASAPIGVGAIVATFVLVAVMAALKRIFPENAAARGARHGLRPGGGDAQA